MRTAGKRRITVKSGPQIDQSDCAIWQNIIRLPYNNWLFLSKQFNSEHTHKQSKCMLELCVSRMLSCLQCFRDGFK